MGQTFENITRKNLQDAFRYFNGKYPQKLDRLIPPQGVTVKEFLALPIEPFLEPLINNYVSLDRILYEMVTRAKCLPDWIFHTLVICIANEFLDTHALTYRDQNLLRKAIKTKKSWLNGYKRDSDLNYANTKAIQYSHLMLDRIVGDNTIEGPYDPVALSGSKYMKAENSRYTGELAKYVTDKDNVVDITLHSFIIHMSRSIEDKALGDIYEIDLFTRLKQKLEQLILNADEQVPGITLRSNVYFLSEKKLKIHSRNRFSGRAAATIQRFITGRGFHKN